MGRNRAAVLMSLLLLGLAGLAPATAAPAGDLEQQVASVTTDLAGIAIQPLVAYDSVTVTIVGPEGASYSRVFAAGETPAVAFSDTEGNPFADGGYSYEVVMTPVLSAKERAARAETRGRGGDGLTGPVFDQPMVVSGFFRLVNGSPVSADLSEDTDLRVQTAPAISNVTAADQVILDDLIVDGSACIGFDCVNGESFGFDTLRLKENNLRIKFQDTSSSASFPSADWQLTANDSANGGQNKFSIDNITDPGGRTPFTIEAGAPSNSLYVDDGGRIGFGTSTPVVNCLHCKDGNTPTLRLEQDGSSGFTPQTWDVAGNEANFFIRDATNGSTLPFRIRLGAPTSAIDIASDGDIGIGTASPDVDLHVRRTDAGATNFVLENANATAQAIQIRMRTDSTNRRFQARNAANGTESQLQFGDAGNFAFAGETDSSGVCLQFRDSDDAGDTNCTFLNGAINCAAGACP